MEQRHWCSDLRVRQLQRQKPRKGQRRRRVMRSHRRELQPPALQLLQKQTNQRLGRQQRQRRTGSQQQRRWRTRSMLRALPHWQFAIAQAKNLWRRSTQPEVTVPVCSAAEQTSQP